MRRFGLPALPALLFTLGTAVASAQQAQVNVGSGSRSCGQWVEARRGETDESTIRSSMILSWVQGFLIGTAEATADERSVDAMAKVMRAGKMKLDPSSDELAAFRQKMFGTFAGWAFDPPDSAAIEVWMDKYCSAHPLELVKRAASTLAYDLLPKDNPKTTK